MGRGGAEQLTYGEGVAPRGGPHICFHLIVSYGLNNSDRYSDTGILVRE